MAAERSVAVNKCNPLSALPNRPAALSRGPRPNPTERASTFPTIPATSFNATSPGLLEVDKTSNPCRVNIWFSPVKGATSAIVPKANKSKWRFKFGKSSFFLPALYNSFRTPTANLNARPTPLKKRKG